MIPLSAGSPSWVTPPGVFDIASSSVEKEVKVEADQSDHAKVMSLAESHFLLAD